MSEIKFTIKCTSKVKHALIKAKYDKKLSIKIRNKIGNITSFDKS